MKQEIVDKLGKLIGEDWVDTDIARVKKYSQESTNESYKLISPEPVTGSVVVKPARAEEISKILKYANQKQIPVIPKGGGTSLSANAIPTEPSIILSVERMNKILGIDKENLMIETEAAVTLGDLIEELNNNDKLYFPLHPGDEGAHIGGMASMNAGGVRAVKHGIMRDLIVGLEVVLPTGEIIELGGSERKLLKNNAGYNLKDLIIGSEGTLGIITRVVLKLYPEPGESATLIIPFNGRKNAFQMVNKILQEGIIPLAVEYIEDEQIQAAAREIGEEWPVTAAKCYLMIILADDKEDDLYDQAMKIQEIAAEFGAGEISIAESNKDQELILDIRSHVLPAIKEDIVDSPDITVPRSKLSACLDFIDELEKKYNTEIPVVAHAGDGNLHVIILKENGEIPDYYVELKKEIYKNAVEMGGTITGEHGIGSLRLEPLSLQLSDKERELMWKIKQAFDPNNILNPGKSIIDLLENI